MHRKYEICPFINLFAITNVDPVYCNFGRGNKFLLKQFVDDIDNMITSGRKYLDFTLANIVVTD